jgi:hypothetical protein
MRAASNRPPLAGVRDIARTLIAKPANVVRAAVEIALSTALLVAAEKRDLEAITLITTELRRRRRARAGVRRRPWTGCRASRRK